MGVIESVLRAGGFEDVTVEPVPALWEFASAENYWEIMIRLAAPLKAAAATLPIPSVPPVMTISLFESCIRLSVGVAA